MSLSSHNLAPSCLSNSLLDFLASLVTTHTTYACTYPHTYEYSRHTYNVHLCLYTHTWILMTHIQRTLVPMHTDTWILVFRFLFFFFFFIHSLIHSANPRSLITYYFTYFPLSFSLTFFLSLAIFFLYILNKRIVPSFHPLLSVVQPTHTHAHTLLSFNYY